MMTCYNIGLPESMNTREIRITKTVSIGGRTPLLIIAGPCVIESEAHTLKIAAHLKKISDKVKLPLVFKTSFDKANRTSVDSYRGPGLKKGLEIIAKVKERFALPVLSDIHEPSQARPAADVLDIIQIPAFLCRQTDIIVAAAKTGKVINIKKGQFLSPWDVKNIIGKVVKAGNRKLIITERGTSFGYNNLVVDMRSFGIMRKFGFPVVYDATHSLQHPGGAGGGGKISGGNSEFAPLLARAAVAAGIDGIFLEVHDDPSKALSDPATVLDIRKLEALIEKLKAIDALVDKK